MRIGRLDGALEITSGDNFAARSNQKPQPTDPYRDEHHRSLSASADHGAVSPYSRAKTAPKSGAVLKTAPKWRHPKLKVRYFEHVFHH